MDAWTLVPFSACSLPGYKTKPMPAWCFIIGRSVCASEVEWKRASPTWHGRERAVVQAPKRERIACGGDPVQEAYGGGVRCSWKGVEGSLQVVWALAQKGTGLA
jgi:hypothetical protein